MEKPTAEGGLDGLTWLSAVSHDSPEAGVLESEAGSGGQGEAFFTKLPADFAPVQVSAAEFSAAMATLWLHMPLRVAASRPSLYAGPALEGVNAELRAMLNPTQILAMLSISITVYMALLVAPVPEPVRG